MKDQVGNRKDAEGVIWYYSLSNVTDITYTKLISRYHDNLLAGDLNINKTHQLVAKNFYKPMFCKDVEACVQGCDIYLALKTVRHEFYNKIQSWPVLTYRLQDLVIEFLTSLPL